MKVFDKLYARNSNNSINKWSISIHQSPPSSVIQIEEGLIDGKQTITHININKGKNIGKINETTHFEQACSQALSKWERKKKQGYKTLIDLKIIANINASEGDLKNFLEIALPKNRTDANNISKPMKAQQYFKDDGSVRIKFPCFAQPKLNGFRVMARWEKVIENQGTLLETEVEKVVFRSKEGLKYGILEHIENDFNKDLFYNNKTEKYDLAFDGECYIHGEILSEISSAVRKRNPKTQKLKFYIFDIAIEKLPQNTRLDLLSFIDTQKLYKVENIVGVFRETIKTNEQAQKFTDQCIKEGYEGAIFRDMKAEYQFGKRPQTMTKLKRSQDKEFKVVDVIGGDNSPELGIFVCINEQGTRFKVTPEGNHEIKKEYLANKNNYIGKMLTVKFFERTKDNLPFHSTGICIRDYE